MRTLTDFIGYAPTQIAQEYYHHSKIKKPDGHNPSGFEITEESITAEVRAPIDAVG
jgi:hypothetical protein